jgi:hypothetical protein
MIIINLSDPDQRPLLEQFFTVIKNATHQDFIDGAVTERRIVCLVNSGVRWYGPENFSSEVPDRMWLSVVSDDIHDAQVTVALSADNMSEIQAVLAERWSEYRVKQQKLSEDEHRLEQGARNERDHQLLDLLRKEYSGKMIEREQAAKVDEPPVNKVTIGRGPGSTSSGSLAY